MGRRAAAGFGIRSRAAEGDRADAARWAAGAEGERRTGRLLERLGPSWISLHDRALPRGRANVDHLVITPTGALVNVDSKMWGAKDAVHVRSGRVFHGAEDRTDRVESALYESRTVAGVLGRPVATVVVVHGARVTGGRITLPGATIVPADSLLALLRQIDRESGRRPDPGAVRALMERAEAGLPPYPG
ncbi:nuclease-like protein [Streptomyces xiamenensis]|uniref:Nuclease-like protein n=2 Tax=Streptomyces TaxID=1883 RepID=A0A0F7G0Q9_9ACTN|nr:nuclease-related domain-containing protein [Streptomyces xiamenensis]AKG46259.1 nuclease-like protein [Streptomyces xiamenensis]